MSRNKVEIGAKFGGLKVLEKVEPYISPNSHKVTQYLCRCDCGKDRIVTSSSLTSGLTISCGCVKRRRGEGKPQQKKIKTDDLLGKTFGELTVMTETAPQMTKKGGRVREYLCKCSCGKEKTVARGYLLSGKVTHCGCLKTYKSFHIGEKYGQLTIIKRAENDKRNQTRVVCQCDCGNVVTVRLIHLKSGMTKSCGCLITQTNSTHGKRNTRLYIVWVDMKQRCFNPNNDNYKDYGGRGISVCDEWRNDFQAFYNWSYANGYDEAAPRGQCTLDRINNDGNYCPENCRWVDMKVQRRNQRPTTKGMFEINGISHSLKGWCKVYNISYGTVQGRIKWGWDKIKALTTPVETKYRRKTC